MAFSLVRLKDTDNSTFAWPFMRPVSPLPPAAVSFGGNLYRVSNFGAEAGEYLFTEVSGPFEALEISLSFYGDITMPELAFLAALAFKLGVEPESLSVFRRRGIKGRKNFDMLVKAAGLPESVLSYMARKDVPLKTASLLASFGPGALRLAESRLVSGREPSVGEFIKFVNDAADFKELAEKSEYFPGFSFPERISPARAALESSLKELNAALAPVSAQVKDFFETGGVEFSFKAFSAGDFAEACRRLSENAPLASQFFEKLKNYDIR